MTVIVPDPDVVRRRCKAAEWGGRVRTFLPSGEVIVEEAHRAVSVEYVQATLDSLRGTVGAAAWWSRATWLATLNALAVPLPILGMYCRDLHLARPFADVLKRRRQSGKRSLISSAASIFWISSSTNCGSR
ncbi:hypothetical protein GCM10007388_40850 [Pseudoduganella plicata]|uniref:Uncharacterized protein n=1 Tax=Pseudoduganella plicata TaxID=321984 RepID=A0AA88C9Y4_9BURK|nr:hypothetical protein GCM10007388_40850 [Pseudoduganella plicata]